ncbi:killer toxin [Marasmius fiardii PR-910]|nr:killer toxin [Marasmius fiardii PR-910]
MKLLAVLVPFALNVFTTPVSASTLAPQLGINCRGSVLCSSQTTASLSGVFNTVRGIDDNRQYGDGQNIVCLDHLCAFYQKTGRTNSAALAKQLLQGLLDHKCTRCGSNPTLPGNNVDTGELTVNYVSSPGCEGICN